MYASSDVIVEIGLQFYGSSSEHAITIVDHDHGNFDLDLILGGKS
jgi:hypothetical protein